MELLSGVDIVDLKRFKKALSTGGDTFKRGVFLPSELDTHRISHLASIFSAKEAVMKALSLKNNDWLNIEIITLNSGKPRVKIYKEIHQSPVSYSLSLSRDKDKAIAFFIAII